MARSLDSGSDLELTPDDLLLFSGREKRKALVVVSGRIYDVTGRDLWRKGIHPGEHRAGSDLTDAFEGAPHGREVLDEIPPAGRLIEPDRSAQRKSMSWAVRLGLGASVTILLVVALWRW